jgi:hypothetical protein
MTTRIVRGLIALMLVLPFLSGCARPESAWTLVGTWTNTSYVHPADMAQVIVYGADGTVEAYASAGDAEALATGTYTIERAWIEPEIHWFEVHAVVGSTEYYELDRLTDGGDTYESTWTSTAYPTQMDPAAASYTIRYRE